MIILTPITSGSKIFFSATLALAFHVVLFGLIPEGRALPAKMILSPYNQVLDVNLVPDEPVVRERVERPVREKVDPVRRELKHEAPRRKVAPFRTPSPSTRVAEREPVVDRELIEKVVKHKALPEERRRVAEERRRVAEERRRVAEERRRVAEERRKVEKKVEKTTQKKTDQNANEGVSRTVTYTVDHSRIVYPRFAREAGMEGRVVLSVHVSQKGRVLEARIITSSGHSPLDSSARRQVQEHVAFSPAMEGGQLVSRWVEIALNFSLLDGSVSTSSE